MSEGYKENGNCIISTGRLLLEEKLVARTWGNISARADERACLITPSGMGYDEIDENHLVKVDIFTGEYEGNIKPSGERAIHMAAYRIFEDVSFVIHTHQKYATIAGLTGDIPYYAKVAEYGLPGSEKLKSNVEKILMEGCRTVIMAHHGVLICGKTMNECIDRARKLEADCRELIGEEMTEIKYPEKGRILCQLDDMAQMIGRKIPVISEADKGKYLKRYNAAVVKGKGIAVRGKDKDDEEALKVLAEKALLCYHITEKKKIRKRLPIIDVLLMRYNYIHRYSKIKGEKNEKQN